MQAEQKLKIFDKVVVAIGQGGKLVESGAHIPVVWSEEEMGRRRKILVSARDGNGVVSFPPRILKSNEVAVAKVKDYSVLIACVVGYLRELELPDHLDYLKNIHDEEVAHIKPALSDPGLRGYQMGVSFVPSRNGRGVSPTGFVEVEGELNLKTVKRMYTNVSNRMSPSDIGMMKLIEELGI